MSKLDSECFISLSTIKINNYVLSYTIKLSFKQVLHLASSSCLLLGFKLYFNYSYITCFCLFPIYSSSAFKVCSSIATLALSDSVVYPTVCSTRTPPTTFQHLLSYPFRGEMLVNTRAFYLLSYSSSMYLLNISEY